MQCPKCGYRLNPKGSKCCGICGNYFIPEAQLRRARKLNIALGFFIPLLFMIGGGAFVASIKSTKAETKSPSKQAALCTIVKPAKENKFKGHRSANIVRDGSIWKIYYSIWDPATGKSKKELIVRTSEKRAKEDVKTWVRLGYIQVN